MTVLVTAASEHGATREIAARIGADLTEQGLDVDVKEPGDVGELSGYDAVVVGSAVYMGQWLKPAKSFVELHASELAQRPSWLFSSGPIVGSPPESDPAEAARGDALAASVDARDHKVFAGKLDKSKLSWCERIAVHAAHASEGDHRDWQAIDDWAAAIGRELQQTRPPSGGHFDQQSGPDGMPSRPLQVLDMTAKFTGKYVSLTTFRKDGSAVATPVWFVADDDHLLVETDGDSYKVKRIRRNDNVTVATCDARGRVLGEPVAAHAAVLPEGERPRVERLIAKKYRFDRIFVLPIYLAVQRLRGKPLRYDRPVILSITAT